MPELRATVTARIPITLSEDDVKSVVQAYLTALKDVANPNVSQIASAFEKVMKAEGRL